MQALGAIAMSFALSSLLGMPAAHAAPCDPVRVTLDTDPLPADWQQALDTLVGATAREGQPWSCPKAQLSVMLDAKRGEAVLRVLDPEGGSTVRHVPSPANLVAMGEALLAAPTADPVAPPTETLPGEVPSAPALHEHTLKAAVRDLLIDGLLGARYAGPARLFWGGGALRATLPLGAWSGGIWARFDLPAWSLDPTPPDFSISEVSIGLSFGRRLKDGTLGIDAAFSPSLAVITMEGGQEPDIEQGSRLDPRLGLGLSAAWTFAPTWRALVAVDGEVAIGALNGSAARRVDVELPVLPAFTLGLSVGIGAIIQ